MSERSGGGAQLFLRFPRVDPATRPVIASGGYEEPVSALKRWRDWPDRRFALIGAPESGRTRLLTMWAAEAGAAMTTGAELAVADLDAVAQLSISSLAVDDADYPGAAHALLAAINLCSRRNAPILMSGERDPAGWFDAPPDLRSRLLATSHVSISDPDRDTLKLRLEEAFLQRHLRIPEESVTYLSQNMHPHWKAVNRLADHIEATAGRQFSLRAARAALEAVGM